MKKNKIIYWTITGFISVFWLFSAGIMLTPAMISGFRHLGFPDYLRIELVFAKLLAVTMILIPQIPLRMKEWAYAGLGIVLIQASLAHFMSGDPIINVIEPIIFLIILSVSNIYLHKIENDEKVEAKSVISL